jgi:hypothetical protein
MRKKLTDKFIASVQPPKKGRLEFNDLLEPGHVFCVTEHDHRSFSVRVWTGPKDKRRQRRVLLGYPALPIAAVVARFVTLRLMMPLSSRSWVPRKRAWF